MKRGHGTGACNKEMGALLRLEVQSVNTLKPVQQF